MPSTLNVSGTIAGAHITFVNAHFCTAPLSAPNLGFGQAKSKTVGKLRRVILAEPVTTLCPFAGYSDAENQWQEIMRGLGWGPAFQ